MNTSAQLDKILAKLLRVKAELGAVMKKESNPFFKSKYADLNTHIEAVEPLLQKYGLLLFQPCNNAYVETIIFDSESGQFVSSQLQIVLTKQDMQQMGSAVTYARRYTLGSLLAMRAEDDDGNRAADHPVKTVAEKVNIAETELKAGNIKTPEQYFEIVETGKAPAPVARPSFRKKIAAAKAESNDDI